MTRLDELASERELSDDVLAPLRARYRDRLKHLEQRGDGDAGHRQLSRVREDIELALLEAERARINELHRLGKLEAGGRRRIERELDLREAQLANFRAED
jgi:CPA1 family monovalent cation:H+ antiporter